MGKHKTTKEWKYWFDKYESGALVWSKYYKTIGFTGKHKDRFKRVRNSFFKKYNLYKRHGDIIITSMTGKKTTERSKKEKKPNFEKWKREELEEVARRYYEINKDKKKSEKDEEASSLNLSKSKISELFNISRSGLYYSKKNVNKRDPEIEKQIVKAFNDSKGVFGRDRIAAITNINYRRVGRYMKAIGLICKIRKAKRSRESKNTNVKYTDLVQRQYNLKNVIATDVSYIPTNKGFAYLSIAINHNTKKLESWNLSKYNDNNLVLTHLRKTDLKNKILHSDHGSQYGSIEYKLLSENKKFKISMSRVGNSLDNREAEYFFSNIKSERLNLIKTHTLSFKDVKLEISNYIDWYNKKRPQSILKWKTPEQFAQMSI